MFHLKQFYDHYIMHLYVVCLVILSVLSVLFFSVCLYQIHPSILSQFNLSKSVFEESLSLKQKKKMEKEKKLGLSHRINSLLVARDWFLRFE